MCLLLCVVSICFIVSFVPSVYHEYIVLCTVISIEPGTHVFNGVVQRSDIT